MDSNFHQTSCCNNFRANLWRPHTCTNCYKSKTLHSNSTAENTSTVKSKRLLKKLAAPARSKKELWQVGSKKELWQVSQSTTTVSVTSAEVVQCVSVGEQWVDMPQRPHKNGPVVGVVKPYAVVHLDEDINGTKNGIAIIIIIIKYTITIFLKQMGAQYC